ncbi:isochorismatase family protein [Roseiterribacter gracilis]|uniref:Isochorismatase n=1 Tax=Roseiterribacter gracilis TaxID=2812848 RepID=A0A8S8X6K8_9PROT|nr:isochorismatase [Rhodospirillales bacterium TMPK1]
MKFRLHQAQSALLLVDLQTLLLPAIEHGAAVVARAAFLAQVARLLDVPVFATEQNPAGLGPTEPSLVPLIDRTLTKFAFDATAEPGLLAALPDRAQIVVAGSEAHVCVLQTAIGLHHAGRSVAVVADAVGSRRASDRETALARLRAAGIDVVSAEMVAFEWLGRSDHPRFRDVLKLLRE